MSQRLDYISINGAAIASMLKTKKLITAIDEPLRGIVETRVSQINGCLYCVDLHTIQARDAGVSQQKLDCLTVWREAPFFSDAERAALAWAESVTLMPQTGAPDDVYTELGAHFSDEQIVDLTLIIAQMNAWNRLAGSFRQLPEPRAE